MNIQKTIQIQDIEAGTGNNGFIMPVYRSIKEKGFASKDGIKALAGLGVPIYAEVAKVLGLSIEEVGKLEAVGLATIDRAIENMTAPGEYLMHWRHLI
jgi:hypothetical protein